MMTSINKGKAFPSLDGMTGNYPRHDQFQFLPGHWKIQNVLDFLRPTKTNLSGNNSKSSRNNMKSQIKNKKSRSISLWNY